MDRCVTMQQREYFRLKLDPPLCADMTIVMIKGKTLEVGSTKVLIEDISGGGLRFLTHLKLPVHDQLVLQFDTEVFSQCLQMYGHIVRSAQWDVGINEYAVKLTMEEAVHREINRVVNRLAIRLRQKGALPDGSFLQGDRREYLTAIRLMEEQWM
ncbi:PilZ domain-containing protein [Brevibacillus sp. WF146]|nr:PilZ domain-containing protein [Brevibacillus sp. WF146]UYZ12634.1 PilZ domain-containing protein [Brevibacillus sp. WF146]